MKANPVASIKARTSLKIITLKSVDSTNTYAIKLARKGEKEITIVRAQAQTAGRGRFKRTWASPQNQGIYVSFILRPHNLLSEVCFFPLITALCVVRTLKNYLALTIKPPNDIMVNKKKLAGILVEAKGLKEKVDFVVVGIGININAQDNELPPGATSLYIETGKKYLTEKIFNSLLSEFLKGYAEFKSGNLKTLLKEAYRYQEKNSLKKIGQVSLKVREKDEGVQLI
jgi:BirA family biotin operon repressor/biotin-[acetyl-CoA-carboxylase] ligase